MKTIQFHILAACLFALLLTTQLFAADNLVRFSIDKAVYDKMSSTQQAALVQRSQELMQFVERDLKGKIPADIQEKIKGLKIKISLTDAPGRDGLFVPQESGEQTIAIQLIQINSNGMKALIAHEIYHAIHYYINPDELPWVREGMAQVFEFITTGELNGMNMYAAINDPMTPLLGEYSPDERVPAQYGHNQLYFYYLYSHCGKDNFFWKLTAGETDGNEKGSFLIDRVLKDMNLSAGECSDFAESAISFEVAKAHNQMQFSNMSSRGKYFLYPGDITPRFKKVQSAEEFKTVLDGMPVLSSYKLPLEEYLKYNVSCSNCAVYYANNSFPYAVSETMSLKSNAFSVILVKLRRN